MPKKKKHRTSSANYPDAVDRIAIDLIVERNMNRTLGKNGHASTGTKRAVKKTKPKAGKRRGSLGKKR